MSMVPAGSVDGMVLVTESEKPALDDRDTRKNATRCPGDGRPGRRVSLVTVRALVRDNQGTQLEGHEWYFCGEPDCEVVYFSNDGRLIHKAALKVRVGVKEKDAPRPVCYCFGHTVESIREEIDRTGRSTVVDSVAAKVRAGDCWCESRNPEGVCCLGELARTVKRATKDLDDSVIMETSPERTTKGNALSGIFAAIAAAVAASICCVAPLMLLTAGISGAWIGSLTALEPYRPLFITAALAFLGIAFYQVYRKPRAEECEGPYCAKPRSRTINKMSLWIVTILIGGLLSFPYIAPRLYATTAAANASGTTTVILTVENMHCATCSISVRESLMQVAGVQDARVSTVPPEAVVSYAPDTVSVEDLTEATEQAGYPSAPKVD